MKNIRYFLVFVLHILVIFNSLGDGNKPQNARLVELSNYVTNLVDQGYKLLNNKNLSLKQRKIAAAKLTENNLDIDSMYNYALGRYRSEMSEAQIQEIKQLYRKLTVNTYANLSQNYDGQKIVIVRSKQNNDVTFVVDTYLSQKNQKPLNISYLLHLVDEKGKSFLISDVITNGISIVESQRSEFTSIIKNSGVDSLIDKLKKKISEQESTKN